MKLGLAVAWPAFWTGVPIKIVVALLFLALGVPPWEMPGLALLLLLSIPIDIWALGLSARTVFLERLRLDPPESVGITLWWQGALLSAVYLPLSYVIESGGVAGAKAVAGRIMEFEWLKSLPVAERISIELVLWAGPAVLMLLLLACGWLFLFGWLIVRRRATAARTSDASYQALVRRWDLLRVPADQPLLLTALIATGVVLVLLFWAAMPVTTPIPHESYVKPADKIAPPIKPAEKLPKIEKLLGQAETAVKELEAKEAKGSKSKRKDKGADKPDAKPEAEGGKKGGPSQAAPGKA
ncbi:MAG: hypothetical protein ACREIS_01580 [Nitrospiraceae bacterium]